MSAAAQQKPVAVRVLRIAVWLAFVAAFGLLYYRYASTDLTTVAATSVWVAYAIYLSIAAVRGLALIPATSVVVLAIPLFPPVPLFLLTLVGIAISSATIYAFAGSLRLGEYFERKHTKHTERIRAALDNNPTTIVAACSFLLVVPTDLVCYVCGALRVSFPRFMTGVLIGEGAICAVYIFAGSTLFDLGKRAFEVDAAAAQVVTYPSDEASHTDSALANFAGGKR
jgi:uncharacterized membrane protein YdjX (TVP38/TMEM64 family)